MKKIMKTATMLMVLGMGFAVMAQDEVRTINIDFRDEAQNTSMTMSLPLSVIESFQPQVEQALAAVRDGDHEVDFFSIWQAVKDAGPMDFVEVKSADADVKVSTTETELLVRVNEKNDGHNIDVSIPLEVCEALFAGGSELDLNAVVEALEGMVGQDLIKITGDQVNGRVWIQ